MLPDLEDFLPAGQRSADQYIHGIQEAFHNKQIDRTIPADYNTCYSHEDKVFMKLKKAVIRQPEDGHEENFAGGGRRPFK